MARRESSLRVRSAEATEHQYLSQVDERETRRSAHDILHQEGDALRVVDHPTHAKPGRMAHASRPASLPLHVGELIEAGTWATIKVCWPAVKVDQIGP